MTWQTVREAINVLRNEGLVVTWGFGPGAGTFACMAPSAQRGSTRGD